MDEKTQIPAIDIKRQKNLILAASVIGSFIVPYAVSAMNVSLKEIGMEFGMGALSLNWLTTMFVLIMAIMTMPAGKICDIYGRKRIYLYGMITFAAGSVLCSVSISTAVLMVSRAIQGIGGSMIATSGVAILTSVFDSGERGKALGYTVASTFLGLSAGPFLGGVLTTYIGWRSIFIVIVPFCVGVIFLMVWKIEGDWIEAKGEKIDYTGSIILGAGLAVLIYGFSKLPGLPGAIMIALGIALLILLYFWEKRVEAPIINVNLLTGNRVLSFSLLAVLINYSATYAISFQMSLYLQYIKGFTPAAAGFILLVQPILQAILSPFAGRLSDRIAPQKVASFGMAIITIGLAILVISIQLASVGFIILSLVFIGIGYALFASPNTNAIMNTVDRKFYGVASGMVATMRVLGQAISMGIVMIASAIYLGDSQITPDNFSELLSSVTATFIVMTILCFAGIFASLARVRNPRK